jgi:hypothetical protein
MSKTEYGIPVPRGVRDEDVGASASGPGSREPSPAFSAASGFDPSREFYRFTNNWLMQREGGHNWHLRDENGNLIDSDQYRHDLIERHRLTVTIHCEPRRDANGVWKTTFGEVG